MKIGELMTRNVEVVRPDATLREAAEKMRDLDVGPIPVCDGDRLQGMLTDRDIVVRGIAAGCDPQSTRVSEVMTADVHYVFEDDDLKTAAELMEREQIRRLVVLDRSKRLVGIVALGDLAADSNNTRLSGEVLEKVSSPAEPERRAA